MQLTPDLARLFKRELMTLLTITLVVVLSFVLLQILVVTFDDEVTDQEFFTYVWPWVGGALLLMWLLVPGLMYLWIKNLSYAIEDNRLVIFKGIITKKSVSIPYAAITDFTLSRSLYERWLGIATLFVQTAGQGAQAGGHEGKLEGIIEFEDLHGSLRQKVKSYQGQLGSAQESTGPVDASESQLLQDILTEVRAIRQQLNR